MHQGSGTKSRGTAAGRISAAATGWRPFLLGKVIGVGELLALILIVSRVDGSPFVIFGLFSFLTLMGEVGSERGRIPMYGVRVDK